LDYQGFFLQDKAYYIITTVKTKPWLLVINPMLSKKNTSRAMFTFCIIIFSKADHP
jgi:hypothetical protein